MQQRVCQGLLSARSTGFYRQYGKRVFDLMFAFAAIITLSPLLLALGLVIRLKLGKPILFRQERIGKNERIFRVHKFRTMSNACDECGQLLPDEKRLTEFGLFLRRWSLDELPQLIDVVTGNLSLVGPRPLLVRYLPRYTARQRCRHLVHPGITGISQIKGRNLLAWKVRFEYDLWYTRNISFLLDMWIITETIKSFFRKDTTMAGGGRDVEEFWGNYRRPETKLKSLPANETYEAIKCK